MKSITLKDRVKMIIVHVILWFLNIVVLQVAIYELFSEAEDAACGWMCYWINVPKHSINFSENGPLNTNP